MRHLILTIDPTLQDRVVQLAFRAGAVAVQRAMVDELSADAPPRPRLRLDLHLSAPAAARLVAALGDMAPGDWQLVSVHPRALITSPRRATVPFPIAGAEVAEDLWEFSHLTFGLALRVVLAAALVAHGMQVGNLPVMLAGLLFLPYHHPLLAMVLGLLRGGGALALHGIGVFLVATALILAAGLTVGWVQPGPTVWPMHGGPGTAVVIGTIVGLAAALASVDDSGRRELIGLAATAHLSVVPVWIGLVLAQEGGGPDMVPLLRDFALAVAALVAAAGLGFLLTGAAGRSDQA